MATGGLSGRPFAEQPNCPTPNLPCRPVAFASTVRVLSAYFQVTATPEWCLMAGQAVPPDPLRVLRGESRLRLGFRQPGEGPVIQIHQAVVSLNLESAQAGDHRRGLHRAAKRT